MNSNLLLIAGAALGLATLTVVVFVLVKIFSKPKSKKDKATNVRKETEMTLTTPPPSLKCTYEIDFNVFYTGSSTDTHVILDRTSPIIEIDMGTGAMILTYLRQPPGGSETGRGNWCEPFVGDTTGLTTESDSEDDDTDDTDDADDDVMVVKTPSVSFQKMNSVEIRQDLRVIDVFVDGEQVFSKILDYVPYLFPGNGTLLPNGAGKCIEIKSFSFF